MQFLKGLIWILLVVLVVIFAAANWTSVPIKLWGGLIADINLPFLMIVMFLIGLVPTLLYHHAVRWRLRGRLSTAERTIADLRAATMTPAPLPDLDPTPPGAA
jgi:uncharacterized integral membrane protein